MRKNAEGRQTTCRSRSTKPRERRLKLHPLFIAVGIWYCFKGELFVFLMSCLVALQHECAHAFAAARLGYKLNKIVLMPFGAVIDGDMRGITFKDEICVALWGPLCNLFTAAFFAALWWFAPTTYAFTDLACYTSLSIALVNLLPAYPLDGGRILKCALARSFARSTAEPRKAEQKAEKICRAITLFFGLGLLVAFLALLIRGTPNFTLLAFGVFLLVGAFGNRDKTAVYAKMDISCKDALSKGVEIKRVAVKESYLLKDAFRFLSPSAYLVLEVYDEQGNKLFDLPQNELSEYFLRAETPYQTIGALAKTAKTAKNYAKTA